MENSWDKSKAFVNRRWKAMFSTRLNKAMFVSFITAAIALTIGAFAGMAIFSVIGILAMIVFVSGTILFSRRKKQEFDTKIHNLRLELLQKQGLEIEYMSKKQLQTMEVFTITERTRIKRRKREYKGSIMVRVVLIIVMIVFLVTLFGQM